jgi:hypothetical protein
VIKLFNFIFFENVEEVIFRPASLYNSAYLIKDPLIVG